MKRSWVRQCGLEVEAAAVETQEVALGAGAVEAAAAGVIEVIAPSTVATAVTVIVNAAVAAGVKGGAAAAAGTEEAGDVWVGKVLR